MEFRRLGKSGLTLSSLSFGSWVTFSNQVDETLAMRLMAIAYERGINFFDNAEGYAKGEAEILMGRALKNLGWSRDSYCVSSKVFWGGDRPTQRGLSRKHVFEAAHAALRRFQLDYLDLFFCHRPDLHTPIEETVRAMDQLIQQGKILYWGTSEWEAHQIMEAYAVARRDHLTPPTMEQPQYNLFCRQKVEVDYLSLYETIGLGTTIWSPLASGILTGKYDHGIPSEARANLPGFEWIKKIITSPEGQEKVAKARALGKLARDLGCTLPQLSLAWCLKNPHVSSVILGASREEQLLDNLKALEVISLLRPEVMEKIEGMVGTRPPAPIDHLK